MVEGMKGVGTRPVWCADRHRAAKRLPAAFCTGYGTVFARLFQHPRSSLTRGKGADPVRPDNPEPDRIGAVSM